MAVIEDYDPLEDVLLLASQDSPDTLYDVEFRPASDGTYTDIILNFSPTPGEELNYAYRVLGNAELSLDDIMVEFTLAGIPHHTQDIVSLATLVIGDDEANTVDFNGENVHVLGNGGDDSVVLTGATSFAALGDGNNTLQSRSGVNYAEGGTGDDRFQHTSIDSSVDGRFNTSQFHGEEGNDVFVVSGDAVRAFGGDGDDTFVSERGAGQDVRYYGRDGFDQATIALGQSADTIEDIVVNAYPEDLDRGPAIVGVSNDLLPDVTLNIPSEVAGSLVVERTQFSPARDEIVVVFVVSEENGPDLLKIMFWDTSDPNFALADLSINRDVAFVS